MLEFTAVPRRALAVYAHPDDPEVSAGGTLARWAAAGAEVWVLVTTEGDKGSEDPGAVPGEVAARRRLETAAATEALGLAGTLHLGYPDGEIEDSREARAAIVRHVRDLQPEVVLCPDPTAVFFGDRYFNHRDHRVTGLLALDAVAPAAANPHYFPEQIAEGLVAHRVEEVLCSGTLTPDTWVDITATLDRKVAALACHVSQVGDEAHWVPEVVRERAAAVGLEVGVAHAEAFRRLRLG